jgi:hypothetical protein
VAGINPISNNWQLTRIFVRKVAMIKCSRFLPSLLVAFTYALLAPLTIWLRMRAGAWYWVRNDTAFGFMLSIFPFAVAAVVCSFQIDLVINAFRPIEGTTLGS